VTLRHAPTGKLDRRPLEEAMREADLPAQQPEAQEEARIPDPDAYSRGTRGAEVSAQTRPGAPLGLIHRVRGRALFARLGRAPARRRGAVWVRSVPVAGGPPAVAYAISRHVGNAVTRNRLRRRLRAAVARERALLSPGRAYLFGLAPDAAASPYADLERSVRECLEVA
jgi:ribonuclease P protein component